MNELAQLMLLIRQLRDELNAMREQMVALRAENAQLREQVAALTTQPEPDIAPPETEPLSAIELEGPALKFPDHATFDINDVPITEMIVQVEDDYRVRTNPVNVERNYVLNLETPRQTIDGTNEDNVFVDARLGPQDFHNPDLIGDWRDALIFPDLPNGSRINGRDGYDAVHLRADEDTNQWFQISNIEYLRVDFGPDSGGECFGDRDLPDDGYVYIDGAANNAVIYDDGFNFVDM